MLNTLWLRVSYTINTVNITWARMFLNRERGWRVVVVVDYFKPSPQHALMLVCACACNSLYVWVEWETGWECLCLLHGYISIKPTNESSALQCSLHFTMHVREMQRKHTEFYLFTMHVCYFMLHACFLYRPPPLYLSLSMQLNANFIKPIFV